MAQTQSTTQNPDSEKIVMDTAAAIEADQALDMSALYLGAGHAVKLAVDEGDEAFLRFLILAQSGNYTLAAAKLVELAVSAANDGSQAAPASNDPLASMFRTPTAPTQAPPAPAPAADPTSDPTTVNPAVDPAQTAPADPAPRGRRQRRRDARQS